MAASAVLAVLTIIETGSAAGSEAWMPAILSDPALADTYLPDFSYAGYHWGEEAPPHPAPTLDVSTHIDITRILNVHEPPRRAGAVGGTDSEAR